MLSTLGLGDYVTQACNGICKFCTATFITTFLPFQEIIFFLLLNWMSVDFGVCSIVQKTKQLLNKTLSHLSWFDWWNVIGLYRCWNNAEPIHSSSNFTVYFSLRTSLHSTPNLQIIKHDTFPSSVHVKTNQGCFFNKDKTLASTKWVKIPGLDSCHVTQS